jgi:hypothetical protein
MEMGRKLGGQRPARVAVVVGLFLLMVVRAASAQRPGSVLKTVVPTEIDGPVSNPYMGWGIWAGAHGFGNTEKDYSVADNTTAFGDDAPLFDWVLIDWDWRSLEPVEGKFNWKDFDAVVNYWSSRDKQFMLRFWVTDDAGWNGAPGVPVLPDWLWAKGIRSHQYKGEGGVRQRELDYADPSFQRIYLPELKKFLAAFAVRYDKPGTPFIFLQVMGYGHWADWACWYSHYKFPNRKFKHDLLAKIMGVYIDTFKHIRFMEMSAPDWDAEGERTLEDRLYGKSLDVAIAHDFGLIWTGFIDGLGGWDRTLKEKYWHSHPVIAEGDWNYDDMVDQHTHGTLEENLAVMLDWHANFGHFYSVAGTYKRSMRENSAFFAGGLRPGGLGYRLVPTLLSWPESVPAGNLLVLRQVWMNRNVGRLYVQHPIKIYLMDSEGKEKFSEDDSSFDETSWVQGETHSLLSVFHLPKNLAPGTYDLKIALVDEKGKPRIRLPIQGEDSEMRYKVGEIQIVPPEGKTPCDKAFCP